MDEQGIIDSHVHLFAYQDGEYPWITAEMPQLRRDYLPENLRPLQDQAGVLGCVAVQARQLPIETDWLLELAREWLRIVAVIGWVDLRAGDLDDQLDQWVDEPLLKGFRHVVIDEAQPDFLERPDFGVGLALIGRRGYSFDLLVLPHQLAGSARVTGRLADQRFVLDHAGLPDIKGGGWSQWRSPLAELARRPNVAMKLSALDFRADWERWRPEDLVPYLDTALELFGADRLMIGSNWPVCTLAASYEQTLDGVGQYLARLTPTEREAILSGSAKRWYRIDGEPEPPEALD